ncbi:maleylpyruvate isomerase family mycothiol-dependent enzyme [Dactylosporangium aurantiacum]|uniref:Maleylpyruvate isomerase family mycothiol-dependent enzyme n=1 Tax=Dactylosporangium aurantiacum TaxID=35754 RepID=A0A9Q9ITB2_9ACTN|nr:maleylpyruvate isomerase family mycothiol-dependent enzyme [Dactylosporangium aurantiacum]MDG6103693.1 maleylpyruvate isomerase family mycothiol-dependent enzyme [Dactylosporangium aurantiacum]UWZ59089.1 maleylpyruvate isomerase family mycothiol-dependent enzyme [Dactylosporangium aurantiacum]
MTDQQPGQDIAGRLAEIDAVHAWIRSATAGLDEDGVRAPSGLPDWTRAHVLVHLGDLSRAFARQARYAVRGETIEVYDGGRSTRDKSIEENHTRDAAWLVEHAVSGLADLRDAWSGLTPQDWQRPCAYRDSPLIATQYAWWRESELHGVDLALGRTSEQWSPALAEHVVTYLQPRLGPGTGVRMDATDAGLTWNPDGAVTVTAPLTALAAWISGRPGVAPTVTPPGPLPLLHAWP